MLIPYVEVRSFEFLGKTLPIFGPLTILGAVVGHVTLIRRAKKDGSATARDAELFAMGVVASAVVASYVTGQSLAGLFVGAAAAYLLARALRLSFARMFDAMFYALPFGWLFLRAGCALVHDHVGIASSSPLAVAFPSGSAFDLGVLEVLVTPLLLLLTLHLGKQPRRPGMLGCAVGLAFAAMRLVVNFAAADRRFVVLTSFQWIALATSAVFLALLVSGRTRSRSRSRESSSCSS